MISTPLPVDQALSARLELADARLHALGNAAVAEQLPARPRALLTLAGGVASYVGPRISLSRAVGLGMSGPVTAADLDALVDLYAQRREDARVLVSPYADATLFSGLGERGFRLDELGTMLARRLDPGDPIDPIALGITVRRIEPHERAAWVATSLAGFSGTDENVPGEMSATFEAVTHVPTTTYYFAAIGGVFAGTAALDVQSGAAHFLAASTLPGERRRGVQTALFRARLVAAQQAGCDLAFTQTVAGGPSQRNAERHGFTTVYSRARMVKPFA
ncbi:MAG: N-acetyltransferase [Byssovorax sp.]